MKRELEIPVDVPESDTLLAEQIAAAVNFVSMATGIDLEGPDLTVATFRSLPTFRAAAIAVCRALYDGNATWQRSRSFYRLIASIVVFRLPEDEE